MRLKFWKKLKRPVTSSNEKGAREAVLEDLFNDFNRNRYVIYKMSFFRGVFFGFGSVSTRRYGRCCVGNLVVKCDRPVNSGCRRVR